ncbi:MAG: PEP/pyruvate-binding domain-containing protein [Anaerolineales bacterium]|nr:PEP/pyruvate-binding domain-containing protein [Anaerolineales bacterium]
MTLPNPSSDRALNIYLTLSEYPILRTRIRHLMRKMLFTRGVVTREVFEAEARQKAIHTQYREGMQDPFGEEAPEIWEERLRRVRDHLTDFYFAYNFPYEEFEELVRRAISEHSDERPDMVTFNPELAPQDMLFDQAEAIEQMPPDERGRYEARLQEIKAVLIRTMISDHLAYINLARRWFTIDDLKRIHQRKIGQGKIGGKSAGMLLAARVLKDVAEEDVRCCVRIPESYYLSSDVMYAFMSSNGLMHWGDQKYKDEAEIRDDYPQLRADFATGKFPDDILAALRTTLYEIGQQPIIVRSSSLLEDNFNTSFAGKYESYFLPNQADLESNLTALIRAVALIYASGLNPDALLYRREKGLIDYDERMAILIQLVEGERFGRYYLPHAAGVGFSRNLYRWSPQIRKEAGFLRLVWGLGTRAVDQIGDDHPRLVALSHPTLYPGTSIKQIRRHSQKYVDVIDLEMNEPATLPIAAVLEARYPPLRYIAQFEEEGYLSSLRTSMVDVNQLVITFDDLLRRTPFARRMQSLLSLLERSYASPVDTEFTVQVTAPQSAQPDVKITLLQCRPQSRIEEQEAHIPENLPEKDIVLATRRMVPRGLVENIDYVVFVPPEGYFSLKSHDQRAKLERAIGSLNALLKDQRFICVGPGRWGTSTPDLGVHIGYGDIYNTRALVELAGQGIGLELEPSFGTHFFQDLMEAHIYPLAICLDDQDMVFNRDFFYTPPNRLTDWLPADKTLLRCLRLICVDDFRPGHRMTLIMDDEEGRAVAFLKARED